MKTLYTTHASAKGGRGGHTKLDDGTLGFDLVGFNEKDKQGANPEQLFAMGYAACFDGALNLAAKQMSLPITDSTTHIEVSLVEQENGFNIAVKLHAKVWGIVQDDAEKLLARAHQICPYSNATRAGADVSVSIVAV